MARAANDPLVDEARASYAAGDVRKCREIALAGLAGRPDDVALLRLAGKASLELSGDDAADLLKRATVLDPDDAETWHELGDALAYEGRVDEAAAAFGRAVELRPDDVVALVDLGHSRYAAGQTAEAAAAFRQALEHDPESVGALRGLADIHRREGRLDEALEAAARLAEVRPEDIVAALDVADLSLELGRLDEAAAAFARLRSLGDDPGHDVFAYHGLIETEIRREGWRRALDLAVDATRVDRLGRTTDVLAFVVTQVFGGSDRPTPTRAEIDAALASSRAEHRLLHAHALVV